MAKVSLLSADLRRETEVEVDRKAVQSRCCASGRVCSSVPHYQSETEREGESVLQCHYSSTQASGSRSLLTWPSDIVVQTALGARGWLGTPLTANRQTHPGEAPGYWCPWVLVRIQHFSLSGPGCEVKNCHISEIQLFIEMINSPVWKGGAWCNASRMSVKTFLSYCSHC